MHLLNTNEFKNISPDFENVIKDTHEWKLRLNNTESGSDEDILAEIIFKSKTNTTLAIIDFLPK